MMKRKFMSISASWPLLVCAVVLISAQDAAPKVPVVQPTASDGPFIAKPYLQLGHTQAPGKLVLMWHAADADANWAVEYQPGTAARWQAAKAPSARRVAVAGVAPHRV